VPSCGKQHCQILDGLPHESLPEMLIQKNPFQKHQNHIIRDHAYLTTYIVSYRAEANRLNQLLLDSLNCSQQFQHHAKDYEENRILQGHTTSRIFSQATNLPSIVTIAIGAKVMYLTNTLMSQGICNSSCGIITAIGSSGYPTIAFPTSDGIKVILLFLKPPSISPPSITLTSLIINNR